MTKQSNLGNKLKQKAGEEISHETVMPELVRLVRMLNVVHGLQLAIPDELLATDDLRQVKKFCVGLLENPVNHPWNCHNYPSLTVRWSVASSLFLFRKRIPAPLAPDLVQNYLDKLVTVQPSPSKDLKDFAKNLIGDLFGKGWDKSYGKLVAQTTPTVSASTAPDGDRLDRASGGLRGNMRRLAKNGDLSQETFFRYAFGEEEIPVDRQVSIVNVRENGKNRLVTIHSCNQIALDPLHKMIYNHLSSKDWLLRGDAEPTAFQQFTAKEGEVFVSGDYESATDNLNLEFYQYILNCVLDTTDRTPESVKSYARNVAVASLPNPERLKLSKRQRKKCKLPRYVDQKRGQLMGSKLSFPFLCLTNYIMFKYLVRRDVPVKINGDDIVFRARPDEVDTWFSGIAEAGLITAAGKTLMDENYFSLNSTFFRTRKRDKPKLVPFIRSKALFKRPDSLQALVGQYGSAFPGFGSDRRSFLRSRFLVEHSRMIWRSRRSVTRGLGLRASWRTLALAGLSRREDFYLDHISVEPSIPPLPGDVNFVSIPSDWYRKEGKITKETIKAEEPFWDEVYNLCWVGAFTTAKDKWKTYWENCQTDTSRVIQFSYNLRLSRNMLALCQAPIPGLPGNLRPRKIKRTKKQHIWVRKEKVVEERRAVTEVCDYRETAPLGFGFTIEETLTFKERLYFSAGVAQRWEN